MSHGTCPLDKLRPEAVQRHRLREIIALQAVNSSSFYDFTLFFRFDSLCTDGRSADFRQVIHNINQSGILRPLCDAIYKYFVDLDDVTFQLFQDAQ